MSVPPRKIDETDNGKTAQAYLPHLFKKPVIDPSVFLAPGSQVLGDVQIGKDSSVWFNVVIRGDVNYVRIGERSNVQDLTMLHVSYQTLPMIVGDDVTIGHSCCLHACTIGNGALIGMGSTLLDGCEIGEYSLIGAGSLVTPGMKIPPHSKALGRPAKVIATLTPEELDLVKWNSRHYVRMGKIYREESWAEFVAPASSP